MNQAVQKAVLVVGLSLSFQVVANFAFANVEGPLSTEVVQVQKLVNERTAGKNEFYLRKLSPGLSLDVQKNRQDRATTANENIFAELDLVVKTFKATDEAGKMAAMKQVWNQISSNLGQSAGAAIDFVDGKPSAASSRTALLIPKSNAAVTTQNVLNTLSAYKRAAKPSDHVYEYFNAEDLTSGSVTYTEGSDASWTPEAGPAAFSLDKDFAVKKCRQLLGWRCVTSMYRAASLGKAADNVKVLTIFVYNLVDNPDHPTFAGDKRSSNQFSGSTAVYIVKESADWVLLYGIDYQWNEDKLSFQKAIQTEFAKDFERFKKRLSLDLKVSL